MTTRALEPFARPAVLDPVIASQTPEREGTVQIVLMVGACGPYMQDDGTSVTTHVSLLLVLVEACSSGTSSS